MNFMCLHCQSIRTAVRARGGGAIAIFLCDQSDEERVYLLPGEPLACLSRCEGVATETETIPTANSDEGSDGTR